MAKPNCTECLDRGYWSHGGRTYRCDKCPQIQTGGRIVRDEKGRILAIFAPGVDVKRVLEAEI